MTDKQCRLVELQAQLAQLTRKRDRLDLVDDADVSAYTLHRLLKSITQVEAELAALHKDLGIAGVNCLGLDGTSTAPQPMSN